jgi:hypothetical protein
MSFRIEVKEEAWQDMAAAMKWYSSKAANLDVKFLGAVEESLEKLKEIRLLFKKYINSSGKLPSGHSRM